ncbi:MAG: UbiX family flavin prenyltransferase [Phycisphaerales bacterium]|nr:UbiX family flavin prenyltransferase [Phycisphaerales bacterium]
MKIAVAISGASGSIYAKVLLDKLSHIALPTDQIFLVYSDNAKEVWQHEIGNTAYKDYPFPVKAKNDFYAPFASGSAGFDTLIICPCSMGTLARIAGGISNDLITRAADVMLKERKKLICVVRETPYNLLHLRNMTTVTEAGGIICPATPSFYSKPQSIEEVAATVIHRVLQLAGIPIPSYSWGSE